MSRNPGAPRRWLHRCLASLLLVLTHCTQAAPTSSAAIPPVPAGAARIWIYRNEGPYEAQQRPYMWLNGRIAGIVEPNGAMYRDVPPGQYSVILDSYGVPYPNQFAEFNLGAGQEAFVKVLSMREKVGGEFGVGSRTRFFTQLFPADAARAAISSTPFYGSR